MLKLDYPASWWGNMWRDALPSGNGKIGASVYGGVGKERILLNHEDLWWRGLTPELPDISANVAKVRELLFSGDPRGADRILADALVEAGYAPRLAQPLPLADLLLSMHGERAFSNYSRQLNMATGEVSVQWQDGQTQYQRQLFVSRADDVVVYQITKEGPRPIYCNLQLDIHDRSDARSPRNNEHALPDKIQTRADGTELYFAACDDQERDFGCVAKVITDGTLQCTSTGIDVSDASRVLILVQVFVQEERNAAWERLQQSLASFNQDYQGLLNPHAQEHGRLFHSVTVDLYPDQDEPTRELSNEELLRLAYKGEAPLALVEKMWAYGRYLLISSAAEQGQPCSLYGLWCGDYQAMWAFHMANENLQMIYWQVLSGNMPDLLLSMFTYYEQMIEDLRTNARCIYGCNGIYLPAPTAPGSGLLKSVQPHIIHWTGGAGWVAQHFFDYYRYTNDKEFLRTRALPFMRQVADFYRDFFTIGPDGYYISCPSNSPENSPSNFWNGHGMGADMETTINATMDFAIAKEVIRNLITAAEILECCSEDVPVWQEMLERIPPYEINEDGAIKEWMHPLFLDNYHHRHLSHIYPVFPGTEVTQEEDPQLFDAFVNAVHKRRVIGLKEQTGWSMAHMANIYARMGEGDLALECLDVLSRSCVNNALRTYHNDWRDMGVSVDMVNCPLQIDANMGWTAAIQEMLMYSKPGLIKILPGLPAKMASGSVQGMLACGNIQISIAWDMGKGTIVVDLLSAQDQTIRLWWPRPVRLQLDEELAENGYACDRTVRLEKNTPMRLHAVTGSTD